jgi:hypothetical protein
MLNSISWQQYVASVLLSTLAWYIYVGLRYYQPEISRYLKIKPKPQSALPEVASAPADLMAPALPEPGTGQQNAEELIFTMTTDDDISDQTLPKGPSDDLLAEAETLIDAFSDSDDKKGFLKLFRLLIGKYDVFADEISLPSAIAQLQSYAAGKLSFPITASEWPQTFES